MEKFESNLFSEETVGSGVDGYDNVSAFIDYHRLTLAWHRNSRRISFGDGQAQLRRVLLRYGLGIYDKIRKYIRSLFLYLRSSAIQTHTNPTNSINDNKNHNFLFHTKGRYNSYSEAFNRNKYVIASNGAILYINFYILLNNSISQNPNTVNCYHFESKEYSKIALISKCSKPGIERPP